MTIAKSRLLVIALLISLGINLAVGGFFAARWIYHDEGRRSHAGFMFDREAARAVLDEKERAAIDTIWRARKSKIRTYFKAYRQTKRELTRLLGQDPLDRQAIDSVQTNLLETRQQIENTLYNTLLETAATLPPDRRKAFFKTGFRKHHMRMDWRKYRKPSDE